MEKTLQLSVSMENTPGQLGRLCRVMAQAGVNIRGVSVSDASDVSIIRLVVSNPKSAQKALREAGLCFVAQDVLIVDLEDKPGAMEEMAFRLGEAGINVQYIYGTSDGGKGAARLVLRVSEVDRAKQVLA
jgi:hypothetical protein